MLEQAYERHFTYLTTTPIRELFPEDAVDGCRSKLAVD